MTEWMRPFAEPLNACSLRVVGVPVGTIISTEIISAPDYENLSHGNVAGRTFGPSLGGQVADYHDCKDDGGDEVLVKFRVRCFPCPSQRQTQNIVGRGEAHHLLIDPPFMNTLLHLAIPHPAAVMRPATARENSRKTFNFRFH